MFSTLTMWVMRGPPPPSLAPVAFSFAFGHGLLNSCGWKCWKNWNWLLLVFQSYPTSLPSVFRLASWVAPQFVLLHFLDVSKRKCELMMKLPAHFPGARKLGGVEPPSRQTASWRRSNFSIFLGKLLNYMTVTILIGSGYNSPIKTVYCPVTATQCFSWFGLLWFFGQWIILVYVIWHLEHQSVSEDRWPLKQDGYTSPRFGDIWIETSFSKNDREILEHTLREGLQKNTFFWESIPKYVNPLGLYLKHPTLRLGRIQFHFDLLAWFLTLWFPLSRLGTSFAIVRFGKFRSSPPLFCRPPLKPVNHPVEILHFLDIYILASSVLVFRLIFHPMTFPPSFYWAFSAYDRPTCISVYLYIYDRPTCIS